MIFLTECPQKVAPILFNMENPQLENGHTDIANEIMDNLAKLHLSGNEWMVLMVVLRKTWGWHKKEDAISLTQFQILTTLSRPSVCEALNKLVLKKVLVASKKGLVNVYGFNKRYSQWTSTEKSTSTENGNQVVPKKEHTKETITKENILLTASKESVCPLESKKGYELLKEKYPNGHKECAEYFGEVQLEKEHKFINSGKQFRFIHQILRAGFSFKSMDWAIEKIKKDRFYEEKGWDFATVAGVLERSSSNGKQN